MGCRLLLSQGEVKLLEKDPKTGDRKPETDECDRSPQPGQEGPLIGLMFPLAINLRFFSHRTGTRVHEGKVLLRRSAMPLLLPNI
jgi:hypothetical protein